MTLLQFVQIALAVILLTLLVYIFIDRICKCVEYCAMYKLIGNLINCSEGKIDGLNSKNVAEEIDKTTKKITESIENF